MKKILVLSVVLFALTGCVVTKGKNGADGAPGGSFEILKQDQYGGREAETTVLIKSQKELSDLYKELNLGDAPAIDFTKHNVAALFMGEKRTGGYSITIKNITIKGDTAVLKVSETKPEGMATMALTQPYCIAAITKTAKVTVEK